MNQKTQQAQLIEQVGIGIDERLKLSPLSARIYALLILSSYEGLTFEEIRDIIKASKSSTSVNINLLTQLNYVVFYTKPGDRKRYFKLAQYSQLTSLEAELQKLDTEILLIEKINNYNKDFHPEKFSKEKSLGSIFHQYLLKNQTLVEETIKEMKRFRSFRK